MLSQTNMLVPEGQGRRQRSRGTCYVDEPPLGFFIAGSTLKKMNGVYVRKNRPRGRVREDGDILLYYEHSLNHTWTMMLAQERPEKEEDADEDLPAWAPEPERNWLIVDADKVDRFSHVGDTIVPGAGVRWKHVHKQSGVHGPGGASAWPRGPGGAAGAVEKAKDDDEEELPWQVIAILDQGILSDLHAGAWYHQKRCDEAVSGKGDAVGPPALTSLEGAFATDRWTYEVVSEKLLVRVAPSPNAPVACTRARGEFVRGLELRQAADGAQWLRLDDPAKPVALDELGTGALDDGAGGAAPNWEGLDDEYDDEDGDDDDEYDDDEDGDDGWGGSDSAAEELDDDFYGGFGGLFSSRRGGGGRGGGRRRRARGRYLNADYAAGARAQLWVQLTRGGADGMELPLRKLEDADCVHLEGTLIEGEREEVACADDDKPAEPSAAGDGAPRRVGHRLAGAFLDAPFIPRLGGEPAAPQPAAPPAADADAPAAAPLSPEAEAEQLRVAAAAHTHALPVGAEVTVSGLVATPQYNGTRGIVLTPVTEDGRQGIRLAKPFSGKLIQPRIVNLASAPPKPAGAAADSDGAAGAAGAKGGKAATGGGAAPQEDETSRQLRVLGLTRADLGLDAPPAGGRAPRPRADGFGVGGTVAPPAALEAALRAAQRDGVSTKGQWEHATSAASALRAALEAKGEAAAAPASDAPSAAAPARAALAPDALVRHGALGARAAAAARAAASQVSVRESANGFAALEKVLKDEEAAETRRKLTGARAHGGADDALRLRAAIVLSHLKAGRDGAALESARALKAGYPRAPAAALAHARCLLRVGRRAEAEAELARAAAPPSAAPGAELADSAWARELAAIMLRAEESSAKWQERAEGLYERGSFGEASKAYGAALECVDAGARDDRHRRAALHANIAACLRREGKPADAVAACDRALALLPRFCRALFRKGVCLLEAARPEEAIAAFEALYRVDRGWAKLPEWLLRAHAAQRRVDGGKPARAAHAHGRHRSEPAPPSAAPSLDDVESIAREPDHYVVLGVTVDATEKQIKTAYRLRSLKFHPDRAGTESTAAFQRIAKAFDVLSDGNKRAAYDEGVDVKAGRGGEDDSEEEDEEHKQSLQEEIWRKYYPERYEFWPFGDPFVHKRKLQAQRAKRAAQERQWAMEDGEY